MQIAEQYVHAFGNLARTNNTILLPSNTGDMSSMVASAMAIYSNLQSKDGQGFLSQSTSTTSSSIPTVESHPIHSDSKAATGTASVESSKKTNQ